MAKCSKCNSNFGFFELKKGVCKQCINEKTPPCCLCNKNFDVKELMDGYCSPCQIKQLEIRTQKQKESKVVRKAKELKDLADKNFNEMILTTETVINLDITERIGIITAECVFGMNIFKDLFAGIRDVVGGRNKSAQSGLKEAKDTVLNELKKEALSVGANAVVGVDLDYSEISGGGKSMLFVVASGTAVKIKK